MKHISTKLIYLYFIIISIMAANNAYSQLSGERLQELHRPFDILLRIYVTDNRFDYARIYNNPKDLQRLSDYIDNLELVDPAELSQEDALAYWINLYNAATLELVLKKYPVKSIKDIGGLFSSPWKKKVVNVNGKELSLGEIESDIIQKRFQDVRTVFALCRAAIGCPPLYNKAFLGESIETQLEEAVQNTLSNEMWLKITDQEILISKIFDWNEKEFKKKYGSVREFIVKYRSENKDALLDPNRKIEYLKYDWDLNKVEL